MDLPPSSKDRMIIYYFLLKNLDTCLSLNKAKLFFRRSPALFFFKRKGCGEKNKGSMSTRRAAPPHAHGREPSQPVHTHLGGVPAGQVAGESEPPTRGSKAEQRGLALRAPLLAFPRACLVVKKKLPLHITSDIRTHLKY